MSMEPDYDALTRAWQEEQGVIYEWLKENDLVFARLLDDRRQASSDVGLQKQSHKKQMAAQKANSDVRRQHGYFQMYLKLAKEIEGATSVFSRPKCAHGKIEIFHICMAPGGYAAAIQRMQKVNTFGITLPESDGGHKSFIKGNKRQPVKNINLDVTMLGSELGLDWNKVSTTNRFLERLSARRPFENKQFDIVVCDGNIVDEEKRNWPIEKYAVETKRLEYSQLVLALQRIKPRGTIIMLMRHVEDPRNLHILRAFDAFSLVQTFKPVSQHRSRGTFYMIAKEIEPAHPAATTAICEWKREWTRVTVPESMDATARTPVAKPEEIRLIMTAFGARLLELGCQPWNEELAGIESDLARYGWAHLGQGFDPVKNLSWSENQQFRIWEGANKVSRHLMGDFVLQVKGNTSK